MVFIRLWPCFRGIFLGEFRFPGIAETDLGPDATRQKLRPTMGCADLLHSNFVFNQSDLVCSAIIQYCQVQLLLVGKMTNTETGGLYSVSIVLNSDPQVLY